MLIKIYDHRIVASEVQNFVWQEYDYSSGLKIDKPVLFIIMKGERNTISIKGPKTLLDEFEKQYNEIMKGSNDDNNKSVN